MTAQGGAAQQGTEIATSGDAATAYVSTYLLHAYLRMAGDMLLREMTHNAHTLRAHQVQLQPLIRMVKEWEENPFITDTRLGRSVTLPLWAANEELRRGAELLPEEDMEHCVTRIYAALSQLREAEHGAQHVLTMLKAQHPDTLSVLGADTPAPSSAAGERDAYDRAYYGLKALQTASPYQQADGHIGVLHIAFQAVAGFMYLAAQTHCAHKQMREFRDELLKALNERLYHHSDTSHQYISMLHHEIEEQFGARDAVREHVLARAQEDSRKRDITHAQRGAALSRPDTEALVSYVRNTAVSAPQAAYGGHNN